MHRKRTPEEIQRRDVISIKRERKPWGRIRASRWYADPINKERRRLRDWKTKGLPVPTRPYPTHCECCGAAEGARKFHNDHDHKTGAFRGWICSNCNTGIGKLGDGLLGLIKAMAYLLWAGQ